MPFITTPIFYKSWRGLLHESRESALYCEANCNQTADRPVIFGLARFDCQSDPSSEGLESSGQGKLDREWVDGATLMNKRQRQQRNSFFTAQINTSARLCHGCHGATFGGNSIKHVRRTHLQPLTHLLRPLVSRVVFLMFVLFALFPVCYVNRSVW